MKVSALFFSIAFLACGAARAASPEFKKSTCVVEMKEFDTKKNQPIPEKDSNHTYEAVEIIWKKGDRTFSLQSRNIKATKFANWDFYQRTRSSVIVSMPGLRTDEVEAKYFYDSNGIKTIESRRREETQESPTGLTITDITYTDASRNRAKLYVSRMSQPDGSVEVVTEQRDPSPAGEDGIQSLSQKVTCRAESIAYEKVKFDARVRKLKTKVETFSKAIDDKPDAELIKDWRNLLKKSDFRSEGRGRSGGSSNSCDRLEGWFDQCIYHRANCWEYNPGGYCYGAPSAWGQCTGSRPPSLGC